MFRKVLLCSQCVEPGDPKEGTIMVDITFGLPREKKEEEEIQQGVTGTSAEREELRVYPERGSRTQVGAVA
jgi:hypothetical protein